MNAAEVRTVLRTVVQGVGTPGQGRKTETPEATAARQLQQITDLLEQLSRFLRAGELWACCLDHAEGLAERGEFRMALHGPLAFYHADVERDAEAEAARLAQPGAEPLALTRAQRQGRAALRCRGMMAAATSRFHVAAAADPHWERDETLRECQAQLQAVCDAVRVCFPFNEELYYLIFNGTVHLVDGCTRLMLARSAVAAAPFLAFACRCLDGVLVLASTKYLPWRMRVYATLCACYETAGDYRGAVVVAQGAADRVAALEDLEALDTVPPTPAEQRTLTEASEAARLLVLKYTACAQPDRRDADAAEAPQGGTAKPARGRVVAVTDAPPGALQGGADALERVRAIYGSAPPEVQGAKVVRGLLTLLGGGTPARLHTPPAGPDPSATPRAAMNAAAAEALVAALQPAMAAYARAHDLEVPQPSADAASPLPSRGGARKQSSGKLTKAASMSPQQTARDQPDGPALDALLDPATHALVCRTLLQHQQWLPFRLASTCLEHRLLGVAADGPVSDDMAATNMAHRILSAMLPLLSGAAAPGAAMAEACGGLAAELSEALGSAGLLGDRGAADVVEDAALLMLRQWATLPHHDEAGTTPDNARAPEVLGVAARCLVAVGHRDVLKVGATALAATALLTGAGATTDALRLAVLADAFLARRQAAFVAAHRDPAGPGHDTFAFLPKPGVAVASVDSLWLRSATDLRTLLRHRAAELRLHAARDREADAASAQLTARASVLRQRSAATHIFGRLSLREEHILSAVEAAVAEGPKGSFTPQAAHKAIAATARRDGPVAVALVHAAAAHLQPNAGKREATLQLAVASLEEAEAQRGDLARAMGIDADGPQAEHLTPAQGLSAATAWGVVAAAAVELEVPSVIDAVRGFVEERFVDLGRDARPFNQSPAARDGLRAAAVAQHSQWRLQAVADCLYAVGWARLRDAPHLDATEYDDTAVTGPDPRRAKLAHRQHSGLRAANALLMACDVASAVEDERRVLQGLHALHNALQPLLEGSAALPIAALRPVAALMRHLDAVGPRRWEDEAVQLLGARAVAAALRLAPGLPAAAQRAFLPTVAAHFVRYLRLVTQRPNPQQQRHIAAVRSRTKALRLYLRLDGDGEQPVALDSPPAKGRAAKTKGGSASPNAAAPVAPSDPTTVFAPVVPPHADRVPPEYLELSETLLFRTPLAAPVLLQECAQPNDPQLAAVVTATASPAAACAVEYEKAPLLPAPLLAVAEAALRAPATVAQRAAEAKGHALYPACVHHAVMALARGRQFDAAAVLLEEATLELQQRRRVLCEQERDALSAVEQAGAKAVAAAATPQQRATALLSKGVARWRRLAAYRGLRRLQHQHDTPFQARLCEISAALLHARLQRETAARATAAAASTTSPTAAAAAVPKKGRRSVAASKQTDKAADRAAASAVPPLGAQSGDESDTDAALDRTRTEAVMAASKAVVLFGRARMVQRQAQAAVGLLDLCTATTAAEPFDTLPDVATPLRLAADGDGPPATPATLGQSPRSLDTSMSGTIPPTAQDGGPAAKDALAFERIEQRLKVVCSEIVDLVERLLTRTSRPDRYAPFLHAPAVRTGRDEDMDDGLERVTSLAALVTPAGRRAMRRAATARTAFLARAAKGDARRLVALEVDEATARDRLEALWAAGARGLQTTGSLPADEELAALVDGDDKSGGDGTHRASVRFATDVPARTAPKPQKAKKGVAVTAQGSARRDLDDAIGGAGTGREVGDLTTILGRCGTSLSELLDVFLYCAKGMQYRRLRRGAAILVLELDERTRGAFAVRLLPTALGLLRASNQNTAEVEAAYLDALREEPRVDRAVQLARAHCGQYQRTEAYRRAKERSQRGLYPARFGNLATAPDFDAVSVGGASAMSGTTRQYGAGGAPVASYRGVVGQLQGAASLLREKRCGPALVELLLELGDLHEEHRRSTDAERSWMEAVDACVGRVGAVDEWRSLDSAALGPAALGYEKAVGALAAAGRLCWRSFSVSQRGRAVDAALLAAEIAQGLQAASVGSAARLFDAPGWSSPELAPGWALPRGQHTPRLAHGLLHASQLLLEAGFPLQAAVLAGAVEALGLGPLRCVGLVVQARCCRMLAAAATGNFAQALLLADAVVRGTRLPDPTLAHLGVTVDAAERVATAAQGTRPGKKAAEPKRAAPAAAPAQQQAPVDDADVPPGFDNALPASDPANVRAVDTFAALLPAGTLPDPTAALYGPALAQQALLAVADALVWLGEVHPSLAWESAAGQEDPAKAPKAPVKPQAAPPPESNAARGGACATALATAERIVSSLAPRKAAAAAVAPPAAARAARSSTPTRPTSATFVAAAGQAAHVSHEAHGITVRGKAVSAQIALVRGQYAQAAASAAAALQLVGEGPEGAPLAPGLPAFTYTVSTGVVQRFCTVRAKAELARGRPAAAATTATAGLRLAQRTGDQYAERFALLRLAEAELAQGHVAAAHEQLEKAARTARALEAGGLDPIFGAATCAVARATLGHGTDTVAAATLDAVERAVRSLQGAAARHGLNPELNASHAALARHNAVFPALVDGALLFAQMLLRSGHPAPAAQGLDAVLVLGPQSVLAETAPHTMVAAHSLLAACRRQLDPRPLVAPAPPPTPLPAAASGGASRRASLSASRGPLDAALAKSADPTPVPLPADDAAAAGALEAAVTANIEHGPHDSQLLRHAFAELAALYARQGTAAGHAAALHMLRTAAQAAAMHTAVARAAASAGADRPLAIEELPPALLAAVTDAQRRALVAPGLAPVAAPLGKDGKELKGPAPDARPTVTHLLQAVAALHARAAAALLPERAELDALLRAARRYLQAHPTDPPVVFAAAPPMGIRPAPAALPPHCVACQLLPGPDAAAGVTLLFGVWANGPARAPEAAESASPAKPGGKGKKPKTADGGSRATSPVRPPPQQPLTLCAVTVDQAALHGVRRAAERVAWRLAATAEATTLDAAVADAPGAADKKGGGDKKPARGGNTSGNTSPVQQPLATPGLTAVEEAKGAMSMGFVEMLVRAKLPQGFTAADLRPFYPTFPLQLHHARALARVLDVAGGGGCVQGNAEFAQWMLQVARALDALSARASQSPKA